MTPHWTPDGSHIVFGHEGRIYVVDAEGSDLRSLSGSFVPAEPYGDIGRIERGEPLPWGLLTFPFPRRFHGGVHHAEVREPWRLARHLSDSGPVYRRL